MNRANFGNQITNGVQVGAVGATSAVGFARQADNAARQAERAKLADASSALNNLSEDEVAEVGQMRADGLRKQLAKWKGGDDSEDEDIVSVDDIMRPNSPQATHLEQKSNRDMEWLSKWKSTNDQLTDIVTKLKGDKENADL